ncbi:hypothetical protein [Telmatospirillum sp.]|uniref:hypothetical protein n=1 Tax=Telmatospirillum sp. TaxID=2079197 RepID=UPI0028403E71|nr:hypothetical protein [Telmatospirillum sp.]MDR3435121.1 hypothetical protein [Telmatospirillum sp.]
MAGILGLIAEAEAVMQHAPLAAGIAAQSVQPLTNAHDLMGASPATHPATLTNIDVVIGVWSDCAMMRRLA